MTPPTVGVVLAVRNNASTVAAALTSVTQQQPPPDAVVVIDGGSDDGTAEIAAGFAGVRVIAQSSTGLGQARNQGIAELHTALIAFCDGDDRWTPGSLELRVNHLRTHPECDAVIGHYLSELVEPRADGDAVPPRRSDDPRPALTPSGLVVRRGALDRTGSFAEHLRIGSDSDWLVRLRQSGARLDVLDDVVLVKGMRATSLSVDVAHYRREMLDVARGFLDRRRRPT